MSIIQPVSLRDLFTMGKFAETSLEMNSSQIVEVLGNYDSQWNYSSSFFTLCYGNLNFKFIDSVLHEIQSDLFFYTYDAVFPSAGKEIELDSWIIWNGLTLVEAEAALIQEDIWFRKIEIPESLTLEGDKVVELITQTNARLIFRGYLDWYLEGISLSKRFTANTALSEFIDYYTY